MSFRTILFIMALVFVFGFAAHAQTVPGPHFVITWKALDSAAPANYRGKVLPAEGSQVSASAALVSANGAVLNLKPYTIYWYLDNDFIGGGVGQQTITFTARGRSEIVTLRAQVPDYPTSLVNSAYIQIASPQVVIVAPYAGGFFPSLSVPVHAEPYFFKASALSSLTYQWTVNNQSVTTLEDPQNLTVNLSNATSGYQLSIDLNLQATNNPLASAHAMVRLTKTNQ